MQRLTIALAALLALGFALPGGATHGDAAAYVTTDGSGVVLTGTYTGGGGNAQTWDFNVLSDTCGGFGSIEIGFTGSCASGASFSTSGTGHFHNYPNVPPGDLHDVTICYAGACSAGMVVVN
jgi:hypothetical protein